VNDADEALVGLDRFWGVNKVFLTKHAEAVAIRSVHSHVLAALPSEEKTEVTFDESLIALLGLKASRLVLCCKASVLRELGLFTAIVKDLSEGSSPSSSEVANFNAFFKLALSRLAYFCKYTHKPESTAAVLFPKATTLFAQDAIITAYRDFVKAVDENAVPKSVGLCRQFSWMLSESQILCVEKYVKDFTSAQRAAAVPLLKLKDGMAKDKDLGASTLALKTLDLSGFSKGKAASSGPKSKLAAAEESIQEKKDRLREMYAPKKKAEIPK
jgi:hypothetical protein